jgi:dTDP-glucose pyrophosphorylase
MAMEGPPITVMIPLGGLGSRFQKEGYTRPKPFVQVMGKPMILWVLDSLKLRPQDELVIVYNPDFLSRKYWPIVTATYPRLRFVELPGPTRGAAETVMIGLRGINATLRAQPVMLVDGDAFYDQDIVSMYREVASKGANGVFYFEDTQPKPMYSYIVFDPSSRRISQVKEKVKISDYANSGCYCFASGVELEKQCCALLDSGSTQLSQDKVGEYYTSGVIAQMIEEGHTFEAVQIDPTRFHVLGTPAQLVDWCAGRNDQAPLRICFDIENTLVTGPRVAGDYSSCEPIAENIATCRALYEQGHTIILQSSRGMDAHKGNTSAAAAEVAAATLASLAKLQIPYHEIDLGTPHNPNPNSNPNPNPYHEIDLGTPHNPNPNSNPNPNPNPYHEIELGTPHAPARAAAQPEACPQREPQPSPKPEPQPSA